MRRTFWLLVFKQTTSITVDVKKMCGLPSAPPENIPAIYKIPATSSLIFQTHKWRKRDEENTKELT